MAKIKSYVEPRRLYRYRSVDKLDREIDAIERGILYCSSFDRLNDPMEGLFASSDLVRKSQKYHIFRNAILNRKTQLGICSFSEIYNHELMWAHYAQEFKGICIAYSLSRLLKALDDNVRFVRMFYNEKVPVIVSTEKNPTELAKMVLSYKSYRWLYEREWRMFGTPGPVRYGDHKCISRVYLGSRMDEDVRERVKTKFQKLKIKTSDMSIDKYSISFT